MTSAARRIAGSCSRSSFRNKRISEPPIGNAISDVRMGKVIKKWFYGFYRWNSFNLLSPQVIPNHQDCTEKERCRVRPHRSGLDPAQHLAQPADRFSDA